MPLGATPSGRYMPTPGGRITPTTDTLLEAARCADLHPVRIKSVEQQALQALHRTRSLWQGDRYLRMLLTHGARSVLRAAAAAGNAGKPAQGLRA